MHSHCFLLLLVAFQAKAKSNFIETVEAHVNLGVDPRRGDQVESIYFQLFLCLVLMPTH